MSHESEELLFVPPRHVRVFYFILAMIVGGMVTYALNQTTPPPTPALDTPILVVMDPSDRVLQYHKIAEKEFARAVKEAVENLPSKSFHK